MARKLSVEVGQRYDRLVVQEITDEIKKDKSGRSLCHIIVCLCDCGTVCRCMSRNLVAGTKRSCGCLQRETSRNNSGSLLTHGLSRTREFRVWIDMRYRCMNLNVKAYKNYGARGIKVCERWASPNGGFENFIADMGTRSSPRHTLDRIDPNGDYEPSNCRWATWKEQGATRRTTIMLTHDNRTMCMSDWANELGLAASAIKNRIAQGYPDEEVFSTRKNRYSRSHRPLPDAHL